MSTIRVGKRHRFTSIDRQAVNDERLSFRALGLLLWLLDKPDGWRIQSETVARNRPEGRDAVRTASENSGTTGTWCVPKDAMSGASG